MVNGVRKAMAFLLTVLLVVGSVIQPAMADVLSEYDTETGYPLLDMIRSELNADEVVEAVDATIGAGTAFELIDAAWLGETEPAKISIEVFKVYGPDGEWFSADIPGIYTAYYLVTPASGHSTYEISRNVTVSIAGEPDAEATSAATTGEDRVNDETEDDLPDEEKANDSGLLPAEPETGYADIPTEEPLHSGPEDAATQAPAFEVSKDDDIAVEETVETAEPDVRPTETSTAMPTLEPTAEAANEPTGEAMEAPDAYTTYVPAATDQPDYEAVQTELPEPTVENGEIFIGDQEAALIDEIAVVYSDTSEADESDNDIPPDNIIIEGPAELTRGIKVTYPSDLGSWSTFQYSVDSKMAYCLEAAKASPKGGNFAQEILESNPELTKALYYGYGGPGDVTAAYFPYYTANVRYIMTHIAASYFYTNSYTEATKGCSSEGLTRYGVKAWLEYLSTLPAPPSPAISLTDKTLTASGAQEGIQVTEATTLKADSRNSITIALPDTVTYHNCDTGATQTGGAVQIDGGTTFYFSAPASVSGTWTTGDIHGSIEKIWKVLVVKTGTQTQDMGSYASETYSGVISIAVDWLSECRLNIMKVDSANTGVRLTGATFGVYSNAACTNQLATLTTGDDGIAACGLSRTADTVYVKELAAPSGYRLNNTVYTVELSGDSEITIMVKDDKQSAGLKIIKKGEVLTGTNVTESGVDFIYKLRRLAGAVYRVTAHSNIYNADGSLLYQKGALIAGNLTTGADGEVFLSGLPLGTYEVEEISAPHGYVLSGEKHTVTLEYAGQEADAAFNETTFVNARQKAGIRVTKADSATKQPLAGAEFALYANSSITGANGETLVTAGTVIETATTNQEGIAVFAADIPSDFAYAVKETKAPAGYISGDKTFEFSFSAVNQTTETVEFGSAFENTAIKAAVNLKKVDAEMEAAQGDANLSGAVYGLYARNDIVAPDGHSGIIHYTDDLVTTMTTDKEGEAQVSGLYPGQYYLKEITPSVGYVLDATEYEADCRQVNTTDIVINVSCTVKEQVIKQPFQIIKAGNNGQTDAALLEGAGFSAWLVSGLSKNADGSYDFGSASPAVIAHDDATEIFTDKNGHAVTIALPYGTYIVRETTTPANFSPVDDFIVTIAENHPDTPQVWRVLLDDEFSAKLKIIKADSSTGRTILLSGTEFSIYDIDNNRPVTQITTYPQPMTHTTFKTDESGTLTIPETLTPGHYRITEISAPDGYLLNPSSVDVTVSADSLYRTDGLTGDAVIEVVMQDVAAKGMITVCKEGEILSGYQNGVFVFESCRLAGVTFDVYAAENIYTADRQQDKSGKRYLEYAAGTLVCTLTTNAAGEASTEALPLGTYNVVEKQTSEGFVLDGEAHEVTIAYENQTTAIVSKNLPLTNKRQRVSISVEKQSEDSTRKLQGAGFTLYAGEDILASNTVIAAAGTCLATAETNESGTLTFNLDLPLGRYLIRETKAPAGYVLSDEVREIDASYQGQSIATVVISETFKNSPIKVAVSKADATTGVELDGAKLTLSTDRGTEIDSWVSVAGKPHIVEGLTAGASYTLREDIAPYGYLLTNTVKFTVAETGEVQRVVMKDKTPTGTITINKSGEFLSSASALDSAGGWIGNAFGFITGGLKDVTFEVYADEAIHNADGATPDYYAADEMIAAITTDSTGIARLEGLPLGKYYVKEASTQSGYVLDEQPRFIDLSYRDSATAVVTYSEAWQNERQRVTVKVTKLADGSDTRLEGAGFGLYAGEDIMTGGSVIMKKDTLIEQRATDSNGELIFESDLPIGYSYYVKEVLPPAGYASDISTQTFRFEASGNDEARLVELEFHDAVTRVNISKQDFAGNELEGAKLSVLNAKGEIVETWTSGKEPHYIEMLPIGKYVLHEECAPEGYLLAENVAFEVEDSDRIQTVTMKDAARPTADSETPQTGDNRIPWLWGVIALAGCGGMGAIFLMNKNKRPRA